MENLLDSNLGSKGFELDDNAVYHLDEARKWTFFLSILGFVFLGIMIIAMLFAVAFGDQMSGSPYFSGVAAIFSIILLIIYIFPLYYLIKFSTESKRAIRTKDTAALSSAMKYLKLHFRFVGILTIIVISIYILAFIIGISFGGGMFNNY